MDLEDVINFRQAERLLAQHEEYEWRACDLRREYAPGDRPAACKRWYVYYGVREINTYTDPTKTPKGYYSLASAIEAAEGFMTRLEDGEIEGEKR